MKAPKLIPLKEIVFRKDNRDSIDQFYIERLSETIIAHGVLQPIIVRELKKGKYETVFGECRTRACRLIDADGHIPAFIETYTDAEAEAVCLIENIARANLTPWEEAKRVARLKELHPDERVEDIATRVGKPATWVAQRLSMSKLLPSLRELVEKQAWPIGHVVLLARLSPELQTVALKQIKEKLKNAWDWRGSVPSLNQLRHLLNDYQHVLSAARWKKDDAELVPAAGACSSCPKRSSQEGLLFQEPGDDPKHDRCLDPKCWETKLTTLVQLSIEKVKRNNDDQAPIYLGNSNDKMPAGMEGTVQSLYNFELTKKSDPKAKPAVVVAGERAGEVCYVKPQGAGGPSQKSRRTVNQETGKPEGPSNKERLEKLKRQRQAKAIQLWSVDLETLTPDLETVVKLAIVHGTDAMFLTEPWKTFSKLKPGELAGKLWETVFPVLQKNLLNHGGLDNVPDVLKEAEQQWCALGQETLWSECYLDAAKEIPLPKVLSKAGVEDPDLETKKGKE